MAGKPVQYSVSRAFIFDQIDAFTDLPFKGNPAAICLLEEEKDDVWMQSVAAEFNLSETAFLRLADPAVGNPSENGSPNSRFHLRWFTPVAEVQLCGHATLAAAHFLFTRGLSETSTIEFFTKSGLLTAKKVDCSKQLERASSNDDKEECFSVELDFPAIPVTDCNSSEIPSIPRTLNGVSTLNVQKTTSGDLIVELPSGKAVADLQPQIDEIRECPGVGVIITGKAPHGSGFDFFTRFFCPKLGINEDPVCGSAHCALASYWSKKLGKQDLISKQVSTRGGILELHMEELTQRVLIRGRAVTVMTGPGPAQSLLLRASAFGHEEREAMLLLALAASRAHTPKAAAAEEMGQSSSSSRRRRDNNNPPLPAPTPSQLLSSSSSSSIASTPNPPPSLPPPPPPHPPSFAFAANAPYPSPPYPPPISYPAPPPPPHPPFYPQFNHFSTPSAYAAPAPNRFPYPYYPSHGWFPFRSSASQASATQPAQPLPYVEHQKATTVRNAINVHKDTIRLVADEQNPDAQLVLFAFDALGDGSFTIHYFAKEGHGGSFSPQYPDIPPIKIPFQKGLGQKFHQPSGSGIDLGFFELDDLSKPAAGVVFPLVISAEACSPSLPTDGQTSQPPSSSPHAQITQAVIEKKDNGEFKVKVVKKVLWVDGVCYELRELFGIASSSEAEFDDSDPGKECVICMSAPKDTAVLPCRHMAEACGRVESEE
ncbi:hypothetical protein ACLOJK_025955 [Asimina triloba]